MKADEVKSSTQNVGGDTPQTVSSAAKTKVEEHQAVCKPFS